MPICYTERLAEAGIEPSVGSVDDRYDNALAETLNGLYKAELIHRRSWKNREAVELDVYMGGAVQLRASSPKATPPKSVPVQPRFNLKVRVSGLLMTAACCQL